MAIEKTITINADTKSAQTSIEKVADSVNQLTQEVTESNKKTQQGFEETNKKIGFLSKAVDGLSNGFKGVGLALKGMGIGLLISGMESLKELFYQNQRIADIFGATSKSIAIIFNDFFDLITTNTSKVSSFFDLAFNKPQVAIKQMGEAIRDNLIERFNSLLEVSGFLGKALAKLFTGDFKGAINSVKDAGKEMVDVFTGVDNTVGKVADYVSETYKSAEALQKVENNAKLAVAQQQRLVEIYDRQAERLRQIRDDDTKTIAERIEANNKLGAVLEKQQQAMLGVANAQIQSAKNQLALNRSIDNQVALTDALANREGILAQIEGFRSEQKVNSISLTKEEMDLAKSKGELENEITINQKKFEAERFNDIQARLDFQKKAIEEERELELKRLQSNIDLYKQGTQARLDAEREFALKKQELDNQLVLKEDEIYKLNFEKDLERKTKEAEDEQLSFEDRLVLLQEREDLIRANQTLSYEEEQKFLEENKAKQTDLENKLADERIARNQTVSDATINTAKNTFDLVGAIAKQGSKLGKAVSIAQATISGIESVQNAFKTASASPVTTIFPAYPFVQAGLAGAFSAVQLQKIISAKEVGTSGGAGSTGAGANVPQAPSFNLVQGTGTNQIAESLARDKNPVRAYVVASEVTSQQSLDRNIQNNATI